MNFKNIQSYSCKTYVVWEKFFLFFVKSESIYHLISKDPWNKTFSISTKNVFQRNSDFEISGLGISGKN